MNSFLESREFQDALQAACRRAWNRLGYGQSTYQSVDDLQQTVLVKFIRWLPRYKGSPKCGPILLIIAKNLLIDAGRHDKPARHSVDWETVDLDSLKGASGKELEAAILWRECMNELTPEERHIVEECWVKGRTSRDVAAELGVTAPTVIARLKKAIAKLEECVKR